MSKQTAETTQEKQIAPRPNGALPATEEESWGSESSDSADLLISKLILMQGTSQLVSDELADVGQIIDSVSSELVGSGREKDFAKISIIPLMSYKTFVVYDVIDGKLEWREEVPVTPENAHWAEREHREKEIAEGVIERRDQSLNFYVMLADQVKDPTAIPYLVSFRRTSYRTGQALATHFLKCQKAEQMGKPVPPAAQIFELGAKKTSKDDNTWWVFTLEKTGSTSKEALSLSYQWYKTLKQGAHRVDESEFAKEETVSSDSSNGAETSDGPEF